MWWFQYLQFASICLASMTLPSVRHYDFLSIDSLEPKPDQTLSLKFSAFNQTFTLNLERNRHLLSSESTLYLHDSLTGIAQLHSIVAHAYHGNVLDEFGLEAGWARILFHEDPHTFKPRNIIFDGSFTNYDGMFHISTVQSYRASRREGLDIDIVSPLSRNLKHKNARLILFKDAINSEQKYSNGHLEPKFLSQNYGCGYIPNTASTVKTQHSTDFAQKLSLKIRSDLKKRAVSTCFASVKKVLPMAIAADCAYTQNFGGPANTLTRIISDWNQASQVYEQTFNIQLAIIEVKIMQGCGNFNNESLPWNLPCSDGFSVNDRLSAFSSWRGSKAPDAAGLWHLMTKCNTGPSVGVAWFNELCVNTATTQSINGINQFVSGVGLSSIVPTEWKVVAHEIGHNFGAIHDCITDQCPYTCDLNSPGQCSCCPCGSGSSCDCKGQFLMHPTDNSILDQFSPCSISLMCAGIASVKTNCFVAPSSMKTISAGVCGNGVTEPGEDCDCGAGCANDSCCNGATCKFQKNARCDDRTDECCANCQPKLAGTVCRPSDDFCTSPSHCTGATGICPTSFSQPDGTSCLLTSSNVSSVTTCASGSCTSRKVQCQSLISSGSFQTVDSCSGQDNQCSLRCATKAGTCINLNGNFIDGTPCVGGGFCKNGQCAGSNVLAVAAYFFQTQPQLAYPIAIASVILLFTITYILARCLCCKKNSSNKSLSRVRKSSISLISNSSSKSLINECKQQQQQQWTESSIPDTAIHEGVAGNASSINRNSPGTQNQRPDINIDQRQSMKNQYGKWNPPLTDAR